MSKAVVILSLSTAILATSTAYLARELYLRDASEAGLAAVPAVAAATPSSSASHTGPGANEPDENAGTPTRTSIPATGDAARAAGVARPADSPKRDAQDDPTAGFARQLVARYDDANQRPVLLEEQRTVIRRQYEKLKERLKLSDSAFEQFVSLVADEQLQAQIHWARCAADPACDPRTQPNPNIDRTAEYQAMLGADGAEAFSQFRSSIGERDAVIQLRGRLADSSLLPEAQAEKLIVALAEERASFSKEAAARGAKVMGWGTALGMLWYTEDSGLPEQYIVEASQYSQRLRTRAAGILSPAQLAAYAQMQDELLAQFTSMQRPPRQNKSSVVRSS
jgi:hypothetical protein